MTNSFDRIDIAIIGGGASGMMAALSAAAIADSSMRAVHIAVFERNDRIGKKLLMTGNGRCNLTNLDQSETHYHGSQISFCRGPFKRFGLDKTLAFFEDLGVVTVTEDKKVYPSSLHASSVLDSLRLSMEEKGIELFTNSFITSIHRENGQYILYTKDARVFRSDTLIVACGGKAAPATGSDGSSYSLLTQFKHALMDPLPAIVQLKSASPICKPLSGNKVLAKADLFVDRSLIRSEYGEVLFTDYGLSGPPILQISGHVSRAFKTDARAKVSICLDFASNLSEDELLSALLLRRDSFPGRRLEDFFTGYFQKRLALTILRSSISHPLSVLVSALSDQDVHAICRSIKGTEIIIDGTMPFSNAQTTIGGISTDGFSPATMESKQVPGMYACGEILDIDGDCGGYNLQWAWSSGFIAGRSAAIRVMEYGKQ